MTPAEKLISISTLGIGTPAEHLESCSVTPVVFDGPIDLEINDDDISMEINDEIIIMEICK